MHIVAKFTVGSEQGIDLFLQLKEAQLKEMYKDNVDIEKLNLFMEDELDHRSAINYLNDITTQLVIVFGDDKALGYSIIKNAYERPSILKDKKAVKLSLYILPEYQNSEVFQSLWQKCLSVTKSYSQWMEVVSTDPLIPFYEDCEFKINTHSVLPPFQLPSSVLIRDKE
ncbi:GNAT family N-acetyltransferase [Chryseobacterium sp. RG1]|uniref:GNAT family N-acetyltransferase n=1 Tax=Chryseobacterium tagetis TaxID=2801334 RepID=A0ABS8A3Q8_9FLAO|nr:GNAT family N-acetyltransferase [Chryseobacterium tagetis]MCA6067958.1 GNAT family N-acetyltransferase [Chryseobacterium tagetis]